ncbi:ABC transporter ATP-binding protein [Ligilactobacillus salivarius]|jgi:ATP-binding cassette subfamily B multidrug efflux pump|uniref:Multidrug resistance ABC transporter ATP-binding and permease protein n=2 Tax=Ligilactobacillus salivarius TaxID=1624 RepID=Q1WV90_LIGS1|nr:ABC transporter ATP-binding protein [Ligilactobacillus salivarius]ABD99027.1 Multidrug resistance ABC transporter ATP-binding and permease protein [Ligilactobacillus salivarius UCC118]MDE1507508.1 ABC transporter ATP-binding protein [Ligilactobacillus salivarius]MDE1522408.1 ABC transporter ATP-binding protein [Ligilactobacillus salivarius]MDE1525973.1 ABC transporter ATP-binding protein [Ligilactobacillus salivarius]OQQ77844.1 multidrug ABC transporter ATP-binding protein [Ligilactobacillu
MVKLMRRNLDWWAVITATIFLGFQVVCDLSLPNLTSNLINNGVAKGNVGYIWQIGLQMLGLTLVGIFAAAGNVYFASTQAQKMGARLRGKIFKKVLSFGNYEMDKFGSSSLITRTTNDVMQIQNVTIMMLRMMIMAPLMLIGASVMAYFNEKRLTSIFLVSIPILLIAIGCAMYFAVPLFQKLQKQIDRINLIFREGLTGVRVIRAFRQDKFEQERFDRANKDYTETGIKVFSIVSLMFPIMTLVLNVTNMGIIWFGAKLIANHEMQVGNLVAFMTYASMILFSFMMLSMIFVLVPRAEAAAKRINAVLEIENSINDVESEIDSDKDKLRASLEFKDVSFRYRGAEDLALDNLSVDVKAGETLAIIGGTGSGKSTLINLIPRLYDVNSGEVLVDGNDVRKYSLHDLHDKVAFVQQKAVLFKGTIRSNLLIGNPEATEEDMWKALEIAQAKDFISDLPDGLDAVVEQGGDNFSGGQKQRLAIARAIIKPASIYVFDDSFSALDFKTDAKLRLALRQDERISKAIIVIVAQRISTVTGADHIVVLDEGKVVGQGTHKELLADNTTYQEIVESQMKGAAI